MSSATSPAANRPGTEVAVEKGFQPGGDDLRSRGYHLESLAIVQSMNPETGEIEFRR